MEFRTFTDFWRHYVGQHWTHTRRSVVGLLMLGALGVVGHLAYLLPDMSWGPLTSLFISTPIVLFHLSVALSIVGIVWMIDVVGDRQDWSTFWHPLWHMRAVCRMCRLMFLRQMTEEYDRLYPDPYKPFRRGEIVKFRE